MNLIGLAASIPSAYQPSEAGWLALIVLILAMVPGLFGALVVGGMNLEGLQFALKEYYDESKVWELTYAKNPYLAMVNKGEDFGGKYWRIPVVIGRPTGRSRHWQSARDNRSATDGVDFMVLRAHDYGYVNIDNETLKASAKDPYSFLEAKTLEIDGMIETLSNSLALALWGNGSGVRGQLDADVDLGTNVVQLRDINDITKFEVDMVLRASEFNDGSGAVEAGEIQIRTIDEDAGSFTVDAVLNVAIPTITADMYLSVDGDYGEAQGGNPFTGVDSWFPLTAPDATPFWGVNRTRHLTRLGGVRLNGAGGTIEEVMVDLVRRMERSGAKPTSLWMNDVNVAALEKSQSSKIRLNDPETATKVSLGFRSFTVAGKHGPITLMGDRWCPADRIYCFQDDVNKLNSLGKAPEIFDTDGISMLRSSTGDGVDVQAQYYANFGSRAPGYNGVASITPSQF